jgi:hypothetical protein
MTQAPNITKDSTSLSVFMPFFFEVMQMVVEETNSYYHQYLDTMEKE